MIFLGILLTVSGIILIFFNLSYSKTKKEFSLLAADLMGQAQETGDVFTEEDIKHLPAPVQKYFIYCGYLGKPKQTYIKATQKDVDFSLGRNKPTIKIDYTQYNFVEKPDRIALIDSTMYGIPFEGIDAYIDGTGSMKGVIAKLFTLFDQRGEHMDQASLVTCLAECLFAPNAALQDYISWEEMDELHAKATISYKGVSAEGIFTFNELGEMISFTTNDRMATSFDGTMERVRWSAVLRDYKEQKGIKRPTTFQGIWHYPEGDLLYFNGTNILIE
jgi:hypothetical protein